MPFSSPNCFLSYLRPGLWSNVGLVYGLLGQGGLHPHLRTRDHVITRRDRLVHPGCSAQRRPEDQTGSLLGAEGAVRSGIGRGGEKGKEIQLKSRRRFPRMKH